MVPVTVAPALLVRRVRRRDGASALEFALILPFVLLLLFGIISYGYMLSFRQSLSQAAAEGARAAAVTISGVSAGQREALATDAVEEALSPFGMSCGNDGLTCDITSNVACGSALCVNVSLDYNYEDSPLLPLPGVGVVMPDRIVYEASAQVAP